MKKIITLKLSFVSLAFAVPLVISGCSRNQPQTDDMMSHPMSATSEPRMDATTTNAMDNSTPSQMDHMKSNSMDMAGSSTNNMTSNNMNMANPPQTGNMESH